MYEDSPPIDELGSDVGKYFRHVKESGKPLVVTDDGKPAGVLLSLETYERLVEDAQFAREMDMLRRSELDVKAGRLCDAREATLELARKHGIPLDQ